MSFIHDALRKAQQLKDGGYSNYEKLITGPRKPVREKKFGKAKWVLVPAVMIAFICAAIIMYQESSGINFSGKKSAESRSASQTRKPVPPPPAAQQQPAPGAAEISALYGDALKAQLAGDSAKAEALYRRVIAANPGHADALNNLGVILMAGDKTGEATDLFKKAISVRPDFADAYYNLACSYAKLRELESGLKFLEQAVMIKPELAAFAGRDNDLQNLRSSPKFRQIVNKKEQG